MPVQRDEVARTPRRNWPAEVCPHLKLEWVSALPILFRFIPCVVLRHCLVEPGDWYRVRTSAHNSERIWSHI